MEKYILWIRSHKPLVFGIIVVLIVTIVGILSVVRAPGRPHSDIVSKGKIAGEVVCLPHRGGGDGPQTLECAIGLRGDDGKHYGLRDQSTDHRLATEFFGKHVEVTGEIRSEGQTMYDTVGTIDVQSVEVK